MFSFHSLHSLDSCHIPANLSPNSTQCKNQVISWNELIGYTMIKLGEMVFKGSVGYTKYKNKIKWSGKESIGYTMQNWGHMVFKEVNCVHNDQIRSYDIERSQLGTEYKSQVIQSWKEAIVYTMIKLAIWSWKKSIWYRMQKSGHMVLKGVN